MATTVYLNIETNTKEAVKDVNKLKKSVEGVDKAATETTKELDKAVKKQSKGAKLLSKGFSGLTAGVKGFGKALAGMGIGLVVAAFGVLAKGLSSNRDVMDAVSTVMGTIGDVGTQVAEMFVDMFKRVSEATGGFDAMQKVIGGALTISLNVFVGLIQGTVLAVQKAQLAWEQSLFGDKDPAKIKTLQENIKETNLKLEQTAENIKNGGRQIANNFVESVTEVGQLAKGVAETTTKAIDEVEVKAAVERSKRLTQLTNDARLALAENDKLQFKFQKDAEDQRQIRDDVSKSIEDRIAANEKLGEILDEQEILQKANAQINLDLADAKLAIDAKNIEFQEEKINAEKNYLDVLENVDGFRSEQDVNRVGLELEQIDMIKSRTEAEQLNYIQLKELKANEILDERQRLDALILIAEEEKELGLERLQNNIDRYKEGTQARVDAENEYNTFEIDSNTKIAELKKENSEVEVATDHDVMMAKLAIANKTMQLIGAVAGKGSKIGKAAAVASATISAIEGTINAFTTAQKSPITALFSAYPYIQAGLAAGFGALQVSQILKTPTPNVGGSDFGGGAPQAAQAPPAFNVVGASPENQLAEAIGEREDKPVQAFVVGAEVSTQQALDRNIVDNATLG